MTGTVTVGKLLGERYRIVKLIGEGGFGAVYQANDERFQATRVVAIKEMSDAYLSASKEIKRLQTSAAKPTYWYNSTIPTCHR